VTTLACSPEFPWACPPGSIREQVVSVDEIARQRESVAWFDKWKKTFPVSTSLVYQLLKLNDRIIVDRIDDVKPLFNNAPKTPGDLAQEMLKKQNDELNKRFMEELERQRKLNEIARFRINDVATPPSGVKQSWGPGVSPSQQQKNLQETLDETTKRLEEELFKRVEQLRQREAELFERLDQLKSTWSAVPRLIELPEPPLAIPPWRRVPIRPFPIIQPIKPLESETHRKVPA